MPRNFIERVSVVIKTTTGTLLVVVFFFNCSFLKQVQAAVGTEVSEIPYLDGYAQAGAASAATVETTKKSGNTIPTTNNTSPDSVPDISNGWSEFFSKAAPEHFASSTPQDAYQYKNNPNTVTSPTQNNPQNNPTSGGAEGAYPYGGTGGGYQYSQNEKPGDIQAGKSYGYDSVNTQTQTQQQGQQTGTHPAYSPEKGFWGSLEDIVISSGPSGLLQPLAFAPISFGVAVLQALGIPFTSPSFFDDSPVVGPLTEEITVPVEYNKQDDDDSLLSGGDDASGNRLDPEIEDIIDMRGAKMVRDMVAQEMEEDIERQDEESGRNAAMREYVNNSVQAFNKATDDVVDFFGDIFDPVLSTTPLAAQQRMDAWMSEERYSQQRLEREQEDLVTDFFGDIGGINRAVDIQIAKDYQNLERERALEKAVDDIEGFFGNIFDPVLSDKQGRPVETSEERSKRFDQEDIDFAKERMEKEQKSLPQNIPINTEDETISGGLEEDVLVAENPPAPPPPAPTVVESTVAAIGGFFGGISNSIAGLLGLEPNGAGDFGFGGDFGSAPSGPATDHSPSDRGQGGND